VAEPLIVVIAEKGTQARELAAALLPNGYETVKYAVTGKGLDGDDIAIVVARGHLYRLAEPEEYDPELRAWRKESLPWLPAESRILPVSIEAERIKTINAWLRRLDLREVVHACDPDREGQLIGDDIIDFAKLAANVTVSRLWSNSMEPSDVRAAWLARKSNDIDEYNFLKIVGNCRREMDLLLGVNGTRWLTLDAREKGHRRDQLFPYGRVQTTTLAFVVERERERAAFVPQTFFVVAALFTHDTYPAETELVGVWRPPEFALGLDSDKRLIDVGIGKKVVATVKGLPGRIRIVDRREIPERPVLPHKMVSLQAEASRRRGLTAAQTMAAAQSLYEDGLISYPGTASRLLPESMIEKVPAILSAIGRTHGILAPLLIGADIANAKNLFVPESEIGGSHSAIIPTRKSKPASDPVWTTHKEWVYDIIARTFVANFLPDKVTAKVSIVFDVAGHVFDASRSFVKSSGWEAALPPMKSNERKHQPLSAFWAGIGPDETVFCADAAVKERTTAPPPAFTEATLVEEMENAHKRVSDDDLRVVLQQAEGLGTGRTRGDIIESLVERKLLVRHGTKFVSTDAGQDEVDSLPVFMKVVDFTARTEQMMIEMRKSGNRKHFRDASHEIVRRMIEHVRFVPSRGHAKSDGKPKRRKPVGGGPEQELSRSNKRTSINATFSRGGPDGDRGEKR
jgi:DNA topoisomerase-3